MELFVLICQFGLAAIFLYFGSVKVILPRKKIMQKVSWGEDYSSATLKTFGILEILGGIGVIAPDLLNIFPILTPMAATGLALIMSGAIIVHLRRDEFKMVLLNILLIFIAATVGFSKLIEMSI